MQNKQIYVIGAILSIVLTGCSLHSESNIVQTADSLLWSNPDSCVRYIIAIDEAVSDKTENRIETIYQHAYLKLTHEIEDSAKVSALANLPFRKRDYQIIGEANYILGAYHTQKGEFIDATIYLKQAERTLLRTEGVNPLLLGMVYFYLGASSEQARLFSLAKEYYSVSLTYLRKTDNALYLSACYHHLAKSCTDKNVSLIYLDSALFYSYKLSNPFYHKEIETTRYQISGAQDIKTNELLYENMSFLCDSCQSYSYAAEITHHYIHQENYSKASEYLTILALDTAINIWSREQYYVLKAELLHAQGCKDEAFNIYKELHQQQTTEIQSSAYASTYIISQKYDAARERELRLQETVKKQRAYMWIAFSLLLCILIGGYSYYKYKKGQYELKLGEEEKKRMAQELETHKAILRARISERLQVARKIHSWGSHHEEKIPEELNILSPSQAARDVQNWKRFYDEFNLCFDNLLLRLNEKYPDLTDSDLQYIALTFLGFDITDLCFLLGITNRTIWNRRSIVKQHLNLPEGENQDEWIVKEMPQEFGLIEQEMKRKKKNTKRQRK